MKIADQPLNNQPSRGEAADLPEWAYRAGETTRRGRRYALAQLFLYGATHRPQAVALSDGVATLTFAALETLARGLAGRLVAAGVRPGDRVIVLAEKQIVLPVIAGAIWKAAAVYVPVDAANPTERLLRLIEHVQPAAIIGSEKSLANIGALAGTTALFRFDAIMAAPEGAPESPALPEVAEDDVAYIIFTSGSTALPKGVMISHKSLLDYFFNHNQVLRFDGNSRVFSLAPFHFDVSIEDTLLPLSLGAFVYQFRGLQVGPLMRRILRQERITHLIAVSSLLALLTGDGAEIRADIVPDLAMVMTGAEVCDPRLIDLWVTRLPQARVINAYGPTEATIVCLTHWISAPEPDRSSAYPIGRPLPGVDIALLDASGKIIMAPNQPGELLIGGSQVMLGYLGLPRESETAFHDIDGQRYYRSGDLCHYDDQGRVVYIQRLDDMVKILGRRIHLGEVRNRALAIPAILRAATGVVQSDGKTIIGLAVVLAADIDDPGGHRAVCDMIRDNLSRGLPSYMVPAVIGLTSDTLLTTTTGKTDERRLLVLLNEAVSRHGTGDFIFSLEGSFTSI
jgi:amino acid adenylation domain-containing protein